MMSVKNTILQSWFFCQPDEYSVFIANSEPEVEKVATPLARPTLTTIVMGENALFDHITGLVMEGVDVELSSELEQKYIEYIWNHCQKQAKELSDTLSLLIFFRGKEGKAMIPSGLIPALTQVAYPK